MDAIDRHLSREEKREPAAGFTARVMLAVRREAATPPPPRFPWWRLALGLTACALWLGLGYRAFVAGSLDARTLTSSWEAAAALVLLASLALVRLARVWALA